MSEWLGRNVAMAEAWGRVSRDCRERRRGERWNWRRESEGCPCLTKAGSAGENIVRDGDWRSRDFERRFRVRAMETKPESERISEASRRVWEGIGEESENRERRMRGRRNLQDAIFEVDFELICCSERSENITI